MSTTINSFEELFVAESDRLRRFLRQRNLSQADAEDIAQESWMRLGPDRARTLDNPIGYLRRIAANLSIDEHRRAARRKLSTVEVDALLELPDDAAGPEEHTIARQQIANLSVVLDELPPRQRAILISARLHGVLYRDIAKHYDITTRTVENEIRRALDHCAERMREID